MNSEPEFAAAHVAFPRAPTVLISGAGSGMGLHTAQTLLRKDYAVYAGIRAPRAATCTPMLLLRTGLRSLS